jgi:hypothetical protein
MAQRERGRDPHPGPANNTDTAGTNDGALILSRGTGNGGEP